MCYMSENSASSNDPVFYGASEKMTICLATFVVLLQRSTNAVSVCGLTILLSGSSPPDEGFGAEEKERREMGEH